MMQIIKKSITHSHRNQAGQILILALIFFFIASLVITPLLAYMGTGLKTNQVFDKKTSALYAADSGIEDGKWKIQYDKIPTSYLYNFDSPYSYSISNSSEIGEDINGYSVGVDIKNLWIPESDPNLNLEDLILKYGENNLKNIFGNISKYGNITGDTSGTTGSLIIKGWVMGDIGTAVPTGPNYQLVISYNPGAGENLGVASIGFWLPNGFQYVDNSCSLEVVGQGYYPDQVSDYSVEGGHSVVFGYTPSLPFNDLPVEDISELPLVCKVDLKVTRDADTPTTEKLNAVSWITTSGVPNVPFAWDDDVRYYEIQSIAYNEPSHTPITQVESITSKTGARQLGATVNGDYIAIGNTLMEPSSTSGSNAYYRDRLYRSSNATLQDQSTNAVHGIPGDANIVGAYLYWSGWQAGDLTGVNTVPNGDGDVSPPTDWTTGGGSTTDTRVPTADGDTSGNWAPTPGSPATCWDKVDKTNIDDSSYIVGSATGGSASQTRYPGGDFTASGTPSGTWSVYPTSPPTKYDKVDETSPDGDSSYIRLGASSGYPTPTGNALFTFSNFSVPVGATITDLTIGYYVRDDSSGTNNLRAAVRVNGTNYLTIDPGADPGSSYALRTYSFTTNPNTGSAWTVSDINGTGSHPLQDFGINSIDASPRIRITQVYATVNYSTPAVNNGYQLFNFSLFSIPAGSSISGLTVYIRARDDNSGTNNIRPSIKVGGTLYNTVAPANDPGSSFAPYSYSFNTNPATGTAWQVDDINGTGTRPLQQFGVYSSDLNPGVRVSMVYAAVTYTTSAANRYSAVDETTPNDADYLTGSYDSGGYVFFTIAPFSIPAGTVIHDLTVFMRVRDASSGTNNIRQAIKVNGTRYYASSSQNPTSSFNTLSYSFTANPATGTDWTASDLNGTGTRPLQQIGVYSTDLNPDIQLSMIYARVNFNASTVLSTKVNQVELTVTSPITHQSYPFDITADKYQTAKNPGASDTAWSYSCYKDITGMLGQLIDGGSGDDDPYNAVLGPDAVGVYELGHIIQSGPQSYNLYDINSHALVATTGYPLSTPALDHSLQYQYTYAGWSIIFIYNSPEQEGRHQLYLFDNFRFVDVGGSLNFNISGFLVPQDSTDSHLSYFVGDGDQEYTGERLTVNGTSLPVIGDPYESATGNLNPQNNIFNSRSNSLTDPTNNGIDIDTFDVSECTTTGDTSANVIIDDEHDNLELLNFIYIILSFRSDVTSGGAIDFLINNP